MSCSFPPIYRFAPKLGRCHLCHLPHVGQGRQRQAVAHGTGRGATKGHAADIKGAPGSLAEVVRCWKHVVNT